MEPLLADGDTTKAIVSLLKWSVCSPMFISRVYSIVSNVMMLCYSSSCYFVLMIWHVTCSTCVCQVRQDTYISRMILKASKSNK